MDGGVGKRRALLAIWLQNTFEAGMLIKFHHFELDEAGDETTNFYQGLVGETARIYLVDKSCLVFKIEAYMSTPGMDIGETFHVYPGMDRFEIVKEDNE